MKRHPALAAALLAGSALVTGRAQTNAVPSDALVQFSEGRFAEADQTAARTLAERPADFDALLTRGRISLLGDRLEDAERWLTAARRARPEAIPPREFLAEVCYRALRFKEAAALLRELGRNAMAAQLESFTALVPYARPDAARTRVPFLHTDPLPLVSMRVNGGEPANFLIDTGASEIVLDTAFAAAAHVDTFGGEGRTFGGGTSARVELGHAKSIVLGGLEIRNVPVHILSTRAFASAARGKPVDGVIGTVFLYQFRSTLNYPGGELMLEPRSSPSPADGAPSSQVVLPFWLAGDHFIVTWGRVNNAPPLLLFVDTGLAGAGFTGPAAALQAAGITLPTTGAVDGVTGGGTIQVIPFTLDTLALGAVAERNVAAFFGPFPAYLENRFGFRLGGIVSHSFFRPYVVTVDFTRMELRIAKP